MLHLMHSNSLEFLLFSPNMWPFKCSHFSRIKNMVNLLNLELYCFFKWLEVHFRSFLGLLMILILIFNLVSTLILRLTFWNRYPTATLFNPETISPITSNVTSHALEIQNFFQSLYHAFSCPYFHTCFGLFGNAFVLGLRDKFWSQSLTHLGRDHFFLLYIPWPSDIVHICVYQNCNIIIYVHHTHLLFYIINSLW